MRLSSTSCANGKPDGSVPGRTPRGAGRGETGASPGRLEGTGHAPRTDDAVGEGLGLAGVGEGVGVAAFGVGRGVGAGVGGGVGGGGGGGGGCGAGATVAGGGGVGRGFGAAIETRDGRTLARVAVFFPLVAVNEYDQLPAGRLTARANVTPEPQAEPEPDIGNVPTPGITTATREGGQASEFAYRTLNVTGVPAVAEPGAAMPLERRISWPLPLQLAAATGEPATRNVAATPRIERRNRFMGVGILPALDGTSRPHCARMARKSRGVPGLLAPTVEFGSAYG